VPGCGWLRFAILGCMVVVAAPVLLAQTVNECTIVGEVRIPRKGAPEKRVEVTLETRGASMATAYSDDRGSFEFGHLEGNLYHIVINDDDYEPVNVSVSANPATTRVNVVHIDLIPKKGASVSEPTPLGANAHMNDNGAVDSNLPSISGGNPYVVDQAEYSKQFSAKALKEFAAGVKSDGQGHSDDAITHYKRAVKLAPAFYPARNNLGTAYLNRGDLKAAEIEFEQVMKSNPADAAPYFNLGNIYILTERYNIAVDSLQKGLQKQPNSALGTFLLGSAFEHIQQPSAAEKYLRRSLELDHKLSKAHLALVNLYLRQHRPAEAVEELKEFLQQAPEDPLAPKAKEVLARLQSQGR
jgi:Tfp pilus assembly protein PilF